MKTKKWIDMEVQKMIKEKGLKRFRDNVWKIVGGFLFFFIGMPLLNLKFRKKSI